ncbi:MAG: putative lipid II flippase FtsW [Bradymonadia bacterium]
MVEKGQHITEHDAQDRDTQSIVHRYDRVLLGVVICLMALGIVLVYSASIVSAEQNFGDARFYLKRQSIYALISLGVMGVAMNIHYSIWERVSKFVLVAGIAGLVVVLIPGVATSVKGAVRWISLGPIRIQPSEIIKLAWIIFLAAFISARGQLIHNFRAGWVQPLMLMGLIALLLMSQPDFGSTLICAGMMVLLLWVGGARWKHLLAIISGGVGLIIAAVISEPYRMKRIMAFINPSADQLSVSYHIRQALISFGSGDWFGLGLGESKQKLFYLPEAHTDFVFSILGEEMGLLGVVFVIGLYAVFVWRGLRLTRLTMNTFGGMLAFGLTAEIGFQAVTNMAVSMALLPTKGLTLPFVSFGGSSLVTLGLASGILLNISKNQPAPQWFDRQQQGRYAAAKALLAKEAS